VARFTAAIDEGREADVTGEDGRAALAVISAAYRSCELGRAVTLAEMIAN
jgi:predicted dehydrogenase